MDRATFCKMLVNARKKSGLTVMDISYGLHIPPPNVYRIENGPYSTRMDIVIKYLNYIGYHVRLTKNGKATDIYEYEDITNWFRVAREEKSRQEFAKSLGMNASYISTIENQRSRLGIDWTLKIAEICDYSVELIQNNSADTNDGTVDSTDETTDSANDTKDSTDETVGPANEEAHTAVEKYIIFDNGPCRAPVLALNNKNRYILRIDEGNEVAIAPSEERLLLYYLYQAQSSRAFAEYFQRFRKTGFSALEVSKALEIFKRDHPKTELKEYRLEDIPTYGNTEDEIDLPIPGYCCSIPASFEKELMDTIVKFPYRQTYNRLKTKFEWFCFDYALNFSPKKCADPVQELVKSFYNQHGITSLSYLPSEIKPVEKPVVSTKEYVKNGAKNVLFTLLGYVVLGIIYAGGIGLFGWLASSAEHMFWTLLWSLCLFLLMGLPISLINKNK